MKRFWSDELQDEISRLTSLCVEQQDSIASLERALAASKKLSDYWRNQHRDLTVLIHALAEPEPPSDPLVKKVVDDFIQREASSLTFRAITHEQ